MFVKLSTLALLLPFVSAFTLNSIQVNPTTGGVVTITWTATTTDPSTFSLELVNVAFHNTYAIATNVMTAQGSITFTLPQVPVGDNYSLEAVAINNVNTVYSQTGTFSIGPATTTSTTAASTTSTATTSTSSDSVTSSSVTATTPVSSTTTPVPSASSTASATTSSSATPSTFNSSGATSFKLIGVAPAAALALSAVAGAAMVF